MAKRAPPARKLRPSALTNLPLQLTSFIGRERELSAVKQLLAPAPMPHAPKLEDGAPDPTEPPFAQGGSTAGVRLLTLTGAGGIGKTRLALEAASQLTDAYADGVWWVELAALTNPAAVPVAVAKVMGIRELAREPVLEALVQALAPKDLLLLLDNCEHLRGACATLAETLLRAAPQLQIVATSREPLGCGGERIVFVPSLSLPEGPQPIANFAQYDAIRLFVERATAASANFSLTRRNGAAIVQVCQRLDGMPLALELAAARVTVLTVEQIAARLDQRLSLLVADNPAALVPRHQTLRAAIDWSYDLLSDQERVLFRRVAVFAGGFALDAAEAVCVGDEIGRDALLNSLSSLTRKSLLSAETRDRTEARYRLLETIRQFAAEKLHESAEEASLRARHLYWYLELAETADQHLRGPEQLAWLDRLESEHDNLRAALATSRGNAGAERSAPDERPEAELHLAGALFWFWYLRGYWSEGRRWLDEALAQSPGPACTVAHAKALFGAGVLAQYQGGETTAQAPLEKSVAIWRELVARGECATGAGGEAELRQAQGGLAWALSVIGGGGWFHRNPVDGRALIEESLLLARTAGDTWVVGYTLAMLGNWTRTEGDYATACGLHEESLSAFRATADPWGLAYALHERGASALALGDYATACAHFEEALALYRELGDRWNIALTLTRLGEVARIQGDDSRALCLYEEVLATHRALGSKWGLCFSLHNLGYIAQHRGDDRRAAELFKEALGLNLERRDSLGMASCLAGLAAVAARGEPERAARLFGASQVLVEQVGFVLAPADRIEFERHVASTRAQLDELTFARAWEAGRALPLEEAVREAMRLSATPLSSRAQPAVLVEPLNERERDVLRLIAAGLSNHDIAERLIIAPSTVKWHITNLFSKLGVRSRTQAVARAKTLALL